MSLCARAAWDPRCQLRWTTLLLVLLALAVALGPGPAQARRHHRRKPKAEVAAPQQLSLLAQAQADLAAGQLDGLQARLAAAYRDQPQPELLRLLGLLAEKQGRILRAQDLLRRYFADPLAQPDSQARDDAQRVLTLPRPSYGELQVRGERGAVLLVDNEVVGSLPLPQPLLIDAGSHKVTMEGDETTLHRTIKVRPGRGAVMRFNPAGAPESAARTPACRRGLAPVCRCAGGATLAGSAGWRCCTGVARALHGARQARRPGSRALRFG